jgi:hypothetical protein
MMQNYSSVTDDVDKLHKADKALTADLADAMRNCAWLLRKVMTLF